jgi:hypothetical protein
MCFPSASPSLDPAEIMVKGYKENKQARCGSVIPVLGRLRQEDCDFEASLGYIVTTCLKTNEE